MLYGQKDGKFNFYHKKSGGCYGFMLFEKGLMLSLTLEYLDSSLHTYTFKDERLNGAHTAHYPNDVLREKGSYKDNGRIGECLFFTETAS